MTAQRIERRTLFFTACEGLACSGLVNAAKCSAASSAYTVRPTHAHLFSHESLRFHRLWNSVPEGGIQHSSLPVSQRKGIIPSLHLWHAYPRPRSLRDRPWLSRQHWQNLTALGLVFRSPQQDSKVWKLSPLGLT